MFECNCGKQKIFQWGSFDIFYDFHYFYFHGRRESGDFFDMQIFLYQIVIGQQIPESMSYKIAQHVLASQKQSTLLFSNAENCHRRWWSYFFDLASCTPFESIMLCIQKLATWLCFFILQEPPKAKKVQHSNSKNAVLFEAINLIIHLDR